MSEMDRALRYAEQAAVGDPAGEPALMRSDDAIVMTERALDRPGPAIIFVNPAFERLSGYGREALIGRSPRLLQGFDTDMGELARMRRALDAGDLFEGDIVNYRRSGGEYLMHWVVVPVRDRDGRQRGWLSVQNDLLRDARARRERG